MQNLEILLKIIDAIVFLPTYLAITITYLIIGLRIPIDLSNLSTSSRYTYYKNTDLRTYTSRQVKIEKQKRKTNEN